MIDSCATRKHAISSSDGRRPSRCSGVFSVPSSSSIATPDTAGLRFQVGAQRGDQADLVEQRRPQVDRHLAHAGDQVVDQRDRVADAVGRRGPPARAPELQPQLERGQRLPQLVVQLVREEPALVLLRRLQPPVELPQPLVGDAQLAQRLGGGARVGLDVADDRVDHHRQQDREQRR